MATKIFVNLPVKDLNKTIGFFALARGAMATLRDLKTFTHPVL